ncbi:TonB-dependent receptor [Flavobacterium sp. CGRL2]
MNRLSIHPSYKWITGHIGDVSMTFSPYTLAGHQFTGLGVDLTPQGKFKISAMYGRLVRSSEYDVLNTELVPTYKRFGYGFKTQYSLEKINLGLTFFKAKDEMNSLSIPIPYELGVSPKENAAISFETSFKLFKKLQVLTEFANSSITEDTRVLDNRKAENVASLFLNSNSTTASYKALKGQLVYPAGKGTLGLGYERIDPNYRTLGGYYFNNDLENVTVNASQTLYKDKLSLNLNLGLQKDNLDKQKQSQMKRLVSSISADFRANQKLNFNLNYSNFQSYTNSRNQFDYINQTSEYEFLDTLNFRQVNQNAAITINYLLKNDKKQKQAFNATFSMQDAVNQQEGKTITGGASTYYNTGLSYIIGYPKKDLNLTASFNSTIGKLDAGDNLILGPTIGATKLFYDKKLNTSFSTSYNTSFNDGEKVNDVFNIRLNGSYIYLQKHNFGLNCITLFSSSQTVRNNDITATLSYTYSFDKIKLRPKRVEEKPAVTANETPDNILKISSKDVVLEGTKSEIITKLEQLQNDLKPVPESESEKLNQLLNVVRMTLDDKEFKEKVLDYLDAYNLDKETVAQYNTILFDIVQQLNREIAAKDQNIEQVYVAAIGRVNTDKMHGVNSEDAKDKAAYNRYLKLVERSKKSEEQLIHHRWMMKEFALLAKLPQSELQNNESFAAFSKQEVNTFFDLNNDKKPAAEISKQLEEKMIPFYHQLAVEKAVNDSIELKH